MPSFTRLHRHRDRRRRAFTLVELLVAAAILSLLFAVLIQVLGVVDGAWKQGKNDPFRDADSAFEEMAARLCSATLEPYSDYANAAGAFNTSASATFTPDHLARRSDLAFTCGLAGGTTGLLSSSQRTVSGCALFFVAPQGQTQTLTRSGMDNLLNAVGYFVEFSDEDSVPAFLPSSYHHWRWRMKQVLQNSEQLQVYSAANSAGWVSRLTASSVAVPVLAENVVTLLVVPDRAASDTGPALAPAFAYDSRDTTNAVTLHQLPPRVHLALVAIDGPSADRLAAINGTSPPSLVSSAYFQQAANLDQDLASLDNDLTSRRIRHRIFEREIALRANAWSNGS
jgi:uncharacterized protein (TIGR02599 family)